MTRIKEPDPDSNEVPDYKSPPSRIVRSLRKGYDNQRQKNMQKSDTIQDLREKLRDTQQSRDMWKERTKAAETEIEELKKTCTELEDKKKSPEIIDSGIKCHNYKYTVTQVFISIKCFLGSSAGFRGLSSVFCILQEWMSSFIAPAYTTIRQWLLKIGLYKLNCPKYSPSGWFFIVDTSIQMGSQKCVVILGIKCKDICQDFCPSFDEAEVLVAKPLYSSPGEVINELLEEAMSITKALPKAIISDQGSENKRGVGIFLKNHPETTHVFDISHKINICLKEELSQDRVWLAFKEAVVASLQHLKLSSISYLVPPRQRNKDRMHSAFYLIDWGIRLLRFFDSEKINDLTVADRAKLEWIKGYQFSLPNYQSYKKVCEHALDLVHEEGYFSNVSEEFCKKVEYLSAGKEKDYRFINFKNKIKGILQKEGGKIPYDANYLGSSEVLESLFGKFKYIEDNQASSGLSSLVLSIPALVGKLDESIVKGALETVSCYDIEAWIAENMGTTFLSKRRKALSKVCEEYDIDLELCEL